jgi:N-acetylglucosaminyl-diphospho-decaprenol L-rhamnosyltransferase
MAWLTADVTAVVVTYNSAAVIAMCLASLKGLGRVIVVDNASSDDTISVAKATLGGVEVIANQTNLGFGRACNLGLTKASTPYVLFINPDAALRPDAITRLLQAGAQFPEAAILGPALKNARGITIISHDSSRLKARHTLRRGEQVLPVGACCVDFVLGAVMLARTHVLKDIGGFDESVFLFYEDDDLCERVRKAGHSIVYFPEAVATHLWGSSSKNIVDVSVVKAWHKAWSRLYMVQKHVGPVAARAEAVERIIFYALRTLFLVATFRVARIRASWAELRGALAYILGKGCLSGPS